MSEENAAITVTLKAGAGYDAPWVVVRGDTPDEVANRLSSLESVVQATVEAANFLRAANDAAPVLAGAPEPSQQAAPPPVQPQGGWGQQHNSPPPAPQGVRTHPAGQQCSGCGQVLQFKDVFSRAKNKNFQFWACPAQQRSGDGHDSIFAN